MASARLTGLQAHVLGVIAFTTADAGEVARHLLVSTDCARGVLGRLERRGLVCPVYTGHTFRGRAYTLTDEGEEAYEAEFGEGETDA